MRRSPPQRPPPLTLSPSNLLYWLKERLSGSLFQPVNPFREAVLCSRRTENQTRAAFDLMDSHEDFFTPKIKKLEVIFQ